MVWLGALKDRAKDWKKLGMMKPELFQSVSDMLVGGTYKEDVVKIFLDFLTVASEAEAR